MRPSPELAQIISEKKALYCRSFDTQKWELLNSVMLPDAKWKVINTDGSPRKEGTNASFSSLAAFVAYFSEMFKSLQSIHNLGAAEMEQVSPDEIKSVFAAQWALGPKAEGAPGHVSGGGYYHEVWKRVGDDWLMVKCVFESTYFAAGQQ